MKVLLVTGQYVDIRPDGCWCNFALKGTIENMCVLGELYVLGGKLTDYKKPAQPITEHLDFLSPDHVGHLLPTSRNIRQYIQNHSKNHRKIEQMVEGKDLVIGYAPSGVAEYAQKIAHRHGIPFLTFLVGCPWDSLRSHRRFLARLMAPFSFWRTKRLLQNSEYAHYVTRQFLQERYPTKGKSIGCSDINLGEMDKEVFKRRIDRHEKKETESEIRLVTVGSIDTGYKGQEFVFEAIAKLKELGDSRYHYYLIGGHKGTRLHQICNQLGIEGQVHFLGVKKIDEVFMWLDNSDVYLQPSLQEGLPRSVVEAMSRALPCVGFRTGGIPELLESKYVVEQKDIDGLVNALRMLENESEYRRVAERNFKEAQTYDHSLLQKRIRDFFTEIKDEMEKKQN